MKKYNDDTYDDWGEYTSDSKKDQDLKRKEARKSKKEKTGEEI